MEISKFWFTIMTRMLPSENDFIQKISVKNALLPVKLPSSFLFFLVSSVKSVWEKSWQSTRDSRRRMGGRPEVSAFGTCLSHLIPRRDANNARRPFAGALWKLLQELLSSIRGRERWRKWRWRLPSSGGGGLSHVPCMRGCLPRAVPQV